MKYKHIMAAVMAEAWAIEELKFYAIIEFLEAQAAGIKFTPAEIEARIGKGEAKAVAKREGAVAILPLHGVISNRANMMDDMSGGISSEVFGNVFNAAMADPAVKAIVLDVNSPGGHVSGTDELSSAIFNARGQKPIVAHVNAQAASAAYWIASAADEIVMTPTGSVGSIGVMGMHDDMSGQLATSGITRTVISAGKYKTEGSPYGPLGATAKDYLQARVDEAYSLFIKAVARNRGASQSAVREGYGQGRMVTAEAAIKEGMIDSVGTLREVLSRFGAPAPQSAKAFAMEREKRALAM